MVVLLAIRLHFLGLARRAGLVDGELGRSAFLQIFGSGLDQVSQRVVATVPVSLRTVSLRSTGAPDIMSETLRLYGIESEY